MRALSQATMPGPHGDDVDGKPAVASMAFATRFGLRVAWRVDVGGRSHPLCATRASAPENYPSSEQLVSSENLLPSARAPRDLPRRRLELQDGIDGGPQVRRAGCKSWLDMAGYKTNLYFLPDSGIGGRCAH